MNHKIYKYMKLNTNKNINKLYRIFWIITLKKFKENNDEAGVYFWLKKDNDNYILLYHGTNGLVKQTIKMNEEEKEIIIKKLTCNGFNASETESNSILLTINKKSIIKYVENKSEEETYKTKMPVTPFVENIKRK